VKSRLFRPRLLLLLGLAALLTTGLAVPATPASASIFSNRVLTESFEGSSASTWTFDGSPSCRFCGYVESDSIAAHSGSRSAFIESFVFYDFYSVGKSVHLTWGLFHTCTARLYISHIGAANIEVINPGDWTYLALNSLQGTSVNYQLQSVSWSGGPSDVYFRVSTVPDSAEQDPWANVDDITIDCS
jgi:hypothetical protein